MRKTVGVIAMGAAEPTLVNNARSFRLVKRPIGEESLAGGLGEQDLVIAEQVVDLVALFERDEENLAFTGAPASHQIVMGEEDGRGIGEGRAEEHGRRASIYKIDDPAEIKGDGRTVGLVAVEQYLIVAGDGTVTLQLLNLLGEVGRGEHGAEANERDMRGD